MTRQREWLKPLLAQCYGLHTEQVERIPDGVRTDNLKVTLRDGTAVFVKVYPAGTDLAYEERNVAASRLAHRYGIPALEPILGRRDRLIVGAYGRAVSVWPWQQARPINRPLTADHAEQLGTALACLHRALPQLSPPNGSGWPHSKERLRHTTIQQATARLDAMAAHIADLPTHSTRDRANLIRITERLEDLHDIPALRAALPPPRWGVTHGDFVNPNWLFGPQDLRAVIDFRVEEGDLARELARAAFDVPTITAGDDDWLAIADAMLAAYVDAGGDRQVARLDVCARLAVLHSLCSTYGLEEQYFGPAEQQDDLAIYWARRHLAVRAILARLNEIDTLARHPGVLTSGVPLPPVAVPDSTGVAAPGANATGLPEPVAAQLRQLGVVCGQVLHDTDKSIVLSGQWDDRKVVVKAFTGDDEYWRGRHAAEQFLYLRLNTVTAPVRIPRALHVEPGLTILEHLEGRQLHPARYPQHLDPHEVTRVLDVLDQLHAWQPPPHLLGEPQLITTSYLDRQAATGQLLPRDRQLIEALLAVEPPTVRPEHGDPWSSNILLNDAWVAPVDLEHLGLHIPGVDWAVLTLLWAPANPWVADLIGQRVTREGIETSYAINLMLLACREFGMYTRFGGDLYAAAEPTLLANLQVARQHLHALAAATAPTQTLPSMTCETETL